MLGPATSSYLGSSDHVALTIAANGLRLVLEDQRSTTTPTLKSGKPGKTKVAYGEPDAALKWLWKFVDGPPAPSTRPIGGCSYVNEKRP